MGGGPPREREREPRLDRTPVDRDPDPSGLPGGKTNALITLTGPTPRTEPSISFAPPKSRKAAWSRFVDTEGGQWRAVWDQERRVPSRVYGSGIPAMGASRAPDRAEAASRAALTRHLALFVPGTHIDDFELVSNTYDPSSNLRTVGFAQRHQGLPVRTGAISTRIKNDRIIVIGSEALPDLDVLIPENVISEARARTLADKWIRELFPVSSFQVEGGVFDPTILSWVSDQGVQARVVIEVVVRVTQPIGRWSLYLEAASGHRIARQQTLRFADGTITIRAPERHPGRPGREWLAPNLSVTIDGQANETDEQGRISWPGSADAFVSGRATGSEVRMTNARGPLTSVATTLSDGETFTWSINGEEFHDAQLTTFIAASTVKSYAKALAPDMAWLQQEPVLATVNLNDTCNAFSDGTTINFFSAGRGCQNTGRIPDVRKRGAR